MAIGMKWRLARARVIAAFVAILLNTFAPTLHAIVHADSLAPNFGTQETARKAKEKPALPSNESRCALGQALPGVGPVLAPVATAVLAHIALAPPVAALPEQSLDGILPPRPASRGPPVREA